MEGGRREGGKERETQTEGHTERETATWSINKEREKHATRWQVGQ